MKALPLEDSYLLPDDIFCQPISYVTVSLSCSYFFPCLIDHTSQNMTNFFVLVCLLFHSEEPLQSPNISPAVLPCLHMLQSWIFFLIPAKVDSASPGDLLTPPPLIWAASRRPIGSWYCTIWVLHNRSHQNDVWFAEEYKGENNGCWGVCLVFSCYTRTQCWKLDHCCDWR